MKKGGAGKDGEMGGRGVSAKGKNVQSKKVSNNAGGRYDCYDCQASVGCLYHLLLGTAALRHGLADIFAAKLDAKGALWRRRVKVKRSEDEMKKRKKSIQRPWQLSEARAKRWERTSILARICWLGMPVPFS